MSSARSLPLPSYALATLSGPPVPGPVRSRRPACSADPHLPPHVIREVPTPPWRHVMAGLGRRGSPRCLSRKRPSTRPNLAVVSVLGMVMLPLQGLGAVTASAVPTLVDDP